MRIMPNTGLLVFSFLCFTGSSCEKQTAVIENDGFNFKKGVFIVNEGQFMSSNSSVSFFDTENDSLYNHVFYRSNQIPLGDVANSMSIWKDNGYIVVNNSGKIYRVDRNDMSFRGKVAGLVSPRYITVGEDDQGRSKAYASDLYSGMITVLDPQNDTVFNSINISGAGDRLSTEQMILYNGKLYVSCWSYGRQVLVIDISTDRLVDS
ncbi:MAG: hypothetical protein KAT15_20835, partial [Bacteroidales bacterium]|nr:hypothetical protein [Bacteroidales bacterium]